MSPVVSLRFLTQPAYVLLGGILPGEDSGAVVVRRSHHSVVEFAPEAADAIRYFSTLRSHDDVVRALADWGGREEDLRAFVEARTLVRFPAEDEAAVRAVLEPLTVVVPARATLANDHRTVLLHLPSGRTTAISALTAAVVEASRGGIGDAVRAVADGADLGADTVWRSTVHDLTSILLTGAGHLEEVAP